MKDQKEIFLKSEGNQWYGRNDQVDRSEGDRIVEAITRLDLKPTSILEIGCADGSRLDFLSKKYSSKCYGIEPSEKAVEAAAKKYPAVEVTQGTADKLPYQQKFDLIILGFCLYLCDRNDLFHIAAEVDRVLKDKGHLVVCDFYPHFPYQNIYHHCEDVFTFKMDYTQMFTWNPAYSSVYHFVYDHFGETSNVHPNEKIAVSALEKDTEHAYLFQPYAK